MIGVPAAPTRLTVASGDRSGNGGVVAPANGGSAISSYVITPYLGTVAQPAQTFHSSATFDVVTALTNGKSYTFQVAAHNAVGDRREVGAVRSGEPDRESGADGRDGARHDARRRQERDRRRLRAPAVSLHTRRFEHLEPGGRQHRSVARGHVVGYADGRRRARREQGRRVRPARRHAASCRTTGTCSTRSSTTPAPATPPATVTGSSISSPRAAT